MPVKNNSSVSVIPVLGIAFLLSVSDKYSPYSYYIIFICLLVWFIRAVIRKDIKSVKEITARDVIKYLSLFSLLLSSRHALTALSGCFTMFSVQMLVLLISCCILSALYFCSLKNCSISGKEHRLFMLSIYALAVSAVSPLIQYTVSLLTKSGAEQIGPVSYVTVYIPYIALSIIYFFASRRSLTNSSGAQTNTDTPAAQANAD